jgi:predicted enzyme related to lactoylglutathione lyase
VVPKTEIPQVGWFGVFKDPTGNKVALFTGAQQG